MISFDRDHPDMKKGTIFPNVEEFRFALATYAVRKGVSISFKSVANKGLGCIVGNTNYVAGDCMHLQ